MHSFIAIILLIAFSCVSNGQRVAPGVPPQQYEQQYHQPAHYQHAPPGVAPHQYQPPPPAQHMPQYQQAPVQHQVPMQHQAPMHNQQPPQPAGHGAGHHNQQHGHQVLNAANMEHEKEHIQEHLHVPIDTSKMSEAELQFHYFKMHDSDNNNKLDGCELIKSLIHWHEQGKKEGQHNHPNEQVEEKIFSDEELTALIDPILQMDDTSRDGYIDYPEFIMAQEKARQNQQQQQQQQQQHHGGQ